MKLFQLVSMIALLGAETATAGTYTPPKGCTAFLTTQQRSCRVSHYWTCKGDPEGMRWILTIDADGPVFVQQLDDEFRWIQSKGLRDGTQHYLIDGAPDANSFTELLDYKRDTYDFSQSVIPVQGDPYRIRVTGVDRLTGKQVSIDGETLLVTDFNSHETGDGHQYAMQGNQYISTKWRLFFGGRETETVDGQSHSYDDTPVLFIEPGEAGFLSDQPEYGCEAMMSELTAPLATELEMKNEL